MINVLTNGTVYFSTTFVREPSVHYVFEGVREKVETKQLPYQGFMLQPKKA